jgi:lysophospholipase L1-like esterase
MSRRRRGWGRAAAVFGGIAALLLVFELGLRAAKIFRPPPLWLATGSNVNAADWRIVCAGDSHTEGVGAPRRLDYPQQLDALLAAKKPEFRYRVINLGQSGCNSSEVAERVELSLRWQPERPDVVVFCAGTNNHHNFHHARISPERIAKLDRSELLKLKLSANRVCRFGLYAWDRLRFVHSARNGNREPGSFAPASASPEAQTLREWLLNDIDFLQHTVADRGGHLVLLTYWYQIAWLDDAYREAAERWRLPLIDAHRVGSFGSVLGSIKNPVMIADLEHPNEFGYAQIAALVFDSLQKANLLEPKNRANGGVVPDRQR